MQTVILHCNSLKKNIGVPGVYQSMIANLRKHGADGLDVIGSDYNSYYIFEWCEKGTELKMELVDISQYPTPSFVMFSGFDPYLKVARHGIKWKLKGAKIGFWSWGFFTRQQSRGNWESGRKPRWVKWSAIQFKKITFGPFIDYFFVSSECEMLDSNLPRNKTVFMPMGRPQSAILDTFDSVDIEGLKFAEESINYIGRGKWYSKGLADVVDYAHTDKGSEWTYRFFISSKDEDFDRHRNENDADNIEWYFDVFGANNLEWLYRSSAFIAPSKNPIQTRVAYEAIFSGTPLLVFREGFMDGFQKLFQEHGISNGIRILDTLEFDGSDFTHKVVDHEQRYKMASIMRKVLGIEEFFEWFASWLLNPHSPDSYYEYISEKLKN